MILSVPSYVIPGTYLENLRFLDGHSEVENVELLFFSWDAETKALFKAELPEILEYRRRFSFTVHLPSTLTPDTEGLLEICERFVTHFIVHPPVSGQSLAQYGKLVNSWRTCLGNRFLLENTNLADFNDVREVLPEIPLCMDTGHLLLETSEPAIFAANHASFIRQIHLHGLNGRRDHGLFQSADRWFQELLPFLRSFTGIVELELFSWDTIVPLIALLKKDLNGSRAAFT